MTAANRKSNSIRDRRRDDAPHYHLVLRIPASARVAGKVINAVSCHNEKFTQCNAVLFAKFGASVVSETLDILNNQIRRGRKTQLVVISKVRKSFIAHHARLGAVHLRQPPPEYERFVPDYYQDLQQVPSLWFRLDSPFEACDLKDLRLASNKRSLLDVIRECRTPAMLVEEF
jgi:hypothetical protein